MSEHGLQISQTVALLTTALAGGTVLLTLLCLQQGQPEIIYGLLYLIFTVTLASAAAAYAVSLIWLLVFRIKNDRVGNRPLSFAAVFLPAVFFAATAIYLKG